MPTTRVLMSTCPPTQRRTKVSTALTETHLRATELPGTFFVLDLMLLEMSDYLL